MKFYLSYFGPPQAPTQPSVSCIALTQLATKVSAPVSLTVGDSSSGFLQASVSEAVLISFGPFVKDVASLHSSRHTILSGLDLEEGEVVSVTSTQSPELLDHVFDDGLHN